MYKMGLLKHAVTLFIFFSNLNCGAISNNTFKISFYFLFVQNNREVA